MQIQRVFRFTTGRGRAGCGTVPGYQWWVSDGARRSGVWAGAGAGTVDDDVGGVVPGDVVLLSVVAAAAAHVAVGEDRDAVIFVHASV
ncbi:hypothetical protein PoB_003858900 [Plakobranchus ocellatus]|uniref:Uncharacterized protein n=1 Tax=Plakobranchus ocellatus TaxID=259542 RepID=A0AAV4B094_9GAST|nr:hypothetical protein PoB_003858900 [Plakobranchus ocellatus]